MSVNRRQLLGRGFAFGAAGMLAGWDGALLTPSARAAVADIIGCATWGARAASAPIVLTATPPVKIIVHHTDSANSTDLTPTHAVSLARSIQANHMDVRGFIDSGQHFTISRGGFVLEGRHRSVETLTGGRQLVVGAHCTEQNQVALGIEDEGSYGTAVPPAVLYAALVELCVTICTAYTLRPYQIYGHRDFQATDCPGDQLYARLTTLRRDVAGRVGGDPTAPVWPTLRSGDSGERVSTLQLLLRSRGATLAVDGQYGAATQAAVRALQTLCRSIVDGVAGRQTWNHLANPVASGARGDAVTAIQRQLVAHAISVAVDGIFGTGTAGGVRTYQTRVALPVDGVVDARTWSRLVA
jgi:hypothetical protein